MAWQMVPVLGVRDVRKAVDHYRDVFGFSEVNVLDGVGEEPAVYGIVARDGVEIHLQIRRREVWAGPRERIEGDVYVRVPDADAAYEELSGRGATIFRAIEDEPYGMRDFTVEDPEGHRLSFGSPL